MSEMTDARMTNPPRWLYLSDRKQHASAKNVEHTYGGTE